VTRWLSVDRSFETGRHTGLRAKSFPVRILIGWRTSVERTSLGALLPHNREKYREKSEKVAVSVRSWPKNPAFTGVSCVFLVSSNREEKLR